MRLTNRFLLAVALLGSAAASGSICWAVGVDPTLSYISADEPIQQAAFPPLPDRIDVQKVGTSWGNSITAINSSVSNPVIYKKNSAGIIQLPAGIFRTDGDKHYKSASQNSITSEQDSITRNLGKEPTLDPRKDQAIAAEAPAPVAMNQAITQDLSLPDDAFENAGNRQKKNSSAIDRTMQQMGQQLLSLFRQAGSIGPSLLNKAIHF